MQKLAYLRRSLAAQFSPSRFRCPSCGAGSSDVVDRKWIITQLRRCPSCLLLFRTPTDDPNHNATFYETEYEQGFTTDLPSEEALTKLERINFAGTEKDYSMYIAALWQLGLKPGNRIFDFGCSWGYGSYQFMRAGFDVTAFEIAPTRRRFASDRMGVKVVTALEGLAPSFDCFFSAHVLEHVPSPSAAIQSALRILKPGGIFACFTPNGSASYRAVAPAWSTIWGAPHPQLIDEQFLDRIFTNCPRCIGSSPISAPRFGSQDQMVHLDNLARAELFFAARKL